MIGKVLVGLGGGSGDEGSCCAAATRLALRVATKHQASLTGVTVADMSQVEWVGPAPIGAATVALEMRHDRQEQMRRRLDESIAAFERACADTALPCETLREERREPYDYLVSLARYHDLTLVGLRGLFEYGVAGETHHDPAATLVRLIQGGVRPLIATPPDTRDVNRVLIAYSGSNESAKAMRRYVQMDVWPEADVRLVAFGKDRERRERHLADAAAYCESHGLRATVEHRTDDPKKGVLAAAHEWGADLIVMGNSHRTLLARRVLGDTMLETIRHTDLPLFLAQ